MVAAGMEKGIGHRGCIGGFASNMNLALHMGTGKRAWLDCMAGIECSLRASYTEARLVDAVDQTEANGV